MLILKIDIVVENTAQVDEVVGVDRLYGIENLVLQLGQLMLFARLVTGLEIEVLTHLF